MLCYVSFVDCLEYDWAQIQSPGKRNKSGNLVFQVRFADGAIDSVDCTMMRGMHEMLNFMEQNGINDEKLPPRQWLEQRNQRIAHSQHRNGILKLPPSHLQQRAKLKSRAERGLRNLTSPGMR
jgi:hypothetical protein